MKTYIFTLLLLCQSGFFFAQSTEEQKAVQEVIEQLFDGMRAGDSTAVRSVFYPGAKMQTAFINKEGQAVLRTGSVDRFVAAVGTPHKDQWDEKIWSYEIDIDGGLAAVWTPYTFYLGEKLSHCGVNAFHLFKSDEGWYITQITDSRRTEKCQTGIQGEEEKE